MVERAPLQAWALLLGCAGAAGACAAPTAAPATPELPFVPPAQYGVEASAPLENAATADLAALGIEPWWTDFGAEALDEAIRAALAGNRDLQAAAARVAAARAHTRAVAGARLPQVGAGLELTRARRNLIGLPIPGAPEVIPVTASQHGLGLDLAWEADLWDRLAAAERAAVADERAADEDRRALALALAGQTARTWCALAHQDELIALLEARCHNAEAALALARQRFAAGAGDAAALARVEASLAGLRAQQERERAARAGEQAQLDRQCGRNPRAAASAATSAVLPALPAAPPVGVPATLLERRPDLRAAAARLAASRARADEAAAARLPRLQLTASGGTVSAALGDLLDGDFRVWGLAAGLTAPIFDGGRLRAQAEGAEALAHAAEADYVGRALLGFAEVETALAAEARLRAAHARALEAAASWEREAAAARRRHAGGTGDAAATLTSTDALLDASAAALSLRFALLLNRVDLLLALGGGFGPDSLP
jgi:multidrug efflux system outer membrane protein